MSNAKPGAYQSDLALPLGTADLSGSCCLIRQVFLPVSNREMPPLGAQSPKACISHCDLQQMHVRANIGMRTDVTPHCGRRKIVKITGHPDRTIPCID